MEHTCKDLGCMKVRSHLSIKRVSVKLVLALELLAVSLVHRQFVLSPLENLKKKMEKKKQKKTSKNTEKK